VTPPSIQPAGSTADMQRYTAGALPPPQATHSTGEPFRPPQSALQFPVHRPNGAHSNGALEHAPQLATAASPHRSPPSLLLVLTSSSVASAGVAPSAPSARAASGAASPNTRASKSAASEDASSGA